MTTQKYNYYDGDKLNKFVENKYRSKLDNSALILYSLGLPKLEKKQCGLCGPFTVSHDKLGLISFLSTPTVRKSLIALNKVGVIEMITGQSGKGSKIATRIRRRPIIELQGSHKQELEDYTTVSARKIADILNSRQFNFGNETITSQYNPQQTGRVYAKGELANKSSDFLKNNLEKGMTNGEYLIYADYSQAEPTVIKHILNEQGFTEQCEEPYDLLAEMMDITRDIAKKKFNMLAYSKSATAIIKHWPIPENTFFHRYAEALDKYKAYLWDKGNPISGLRRHCRTLAGTLIEKNKAEKLHKGQLLSWQVQGTIADIMNNVVLKIINLENEKGWQMLFPVHDAVYAKARFDCEEEIVEIMESEAMKLEIPLQVKSESYLKCIEI
ncbi:MAG: hypothetical protein HQ521_19555 [Bacteroidetes bacterium]|nr:hypothetical protein [Bacteroidota bacterium]